MPLIRHIFISCGEASGDRYGAALTAALSAINPDLRISAMGGLAMANAGAEIVQDSEELAIMGFSEVAKALPTVLRVRKKLRQFLAKENVDLVIPIDFPGFNASLAGSAKKLGIPVFWLIAPQVWAWGRWRIPGLRRKIDTLGTILPFEESFFSGHGFSVFPMGHPLMEDYGESFPYANSKVQREQNLANRSAALTIGILPGSRRQELNHLLPMFKVTCMAMKAQLVDRKLKFVVSCAPGVDPAQIQSELNFEVEISQEPLPQLLQRTDLALVCSGTASLEAALAGVPHELVYRAGSFNYWLAQRLLQTRFIGLSNIILDEELVREHLQERAAPLPVSRGLLQWLARPVERQVFYKKVKFLRQMCGSSGVWDRTARQILNSETPDLSGGGEVI